jgi:hypothetical protein
MLPTACFALLTGRAQEPSAKGRNLAKMPASQRLCYVAARSGMDWLRRTNKQDGKFVYGFLPDLRVPLEGDSFTAQAGAAFALIRAARFLGDESSLAIGRQALLSLLLETAADSGEPPTRHAAAPPQLIPRLASGGQLVLAIHELPSPGQDLLEQADQLCNYLRRQQQPNGSLVVTEADEDPKTAAQDGPLERAGLAAQAIVRSQKLRPAPWKLEVAGKARAFAHGCWQQRKCLPLAVSHIPAWAEAYLLTKEDSYREQVFAMADWLCTLQYNEADAVRASWVGGYRPWLAGQAVQQAPDIRTAEAAESLAQACRVARAAGELARLQRYTRAIEESLRFLRTLQYTENRMQHFVESYRPALLGAFHESAQDGKIRIDYAQHAVSALVLYLGHVAE